MLVFPVDRSQIGIRSISINKNSASNNRPQYEALGNKYRVCGVYSQEPPSEVYCLRLNFNISKLVYSCKILQFPANLDWSLLQYAALLTAHQYLQNLSVCAVPSRELPHCFVKLLLRNSKHFRRATSPLHGLG